LEQTVSINPNPESARALLYRHGVPEDVIDGVLCLHAQELAATIRSHPGAIPYRPQLDEDGGFWWDTRDRDAAADLIDPTRASSAVSVVPPATNQEHDGEAEKLAKARRMAKALSAPPVAPPEWATTTEWPGRHKRPGDRRIHATARFVVDNTQRIWTACGEHVGRGSTPLSHMPVDCRNCTRATAAGVGQDEAQS
jgi:hypothetical protein